jgi:hypothetical protein
VRLGLRLWGKSKPGDISMAKKAAKKKAGKKAKKSKKKSKK